MSLSNYQVTVVTERIKAVEDRRSLGANEVADILGTTRGTVLKYTDILGADRHGSHSFAFYPDVLLEAVKTDPKNFPSPRRIPRRDPEEVKQEQEKKVAELFGGEDPTNRIDALEREVNNIPALIEAAEERAFQRAVRYVSGHLVKNGGGLVRVPPTGWGRHMDTSENEPAPIDAAGS